MKRIILIDAYAHIYRAFYAVRNLTNAAGEPSNAIFGIARFLLALEDSQPSPLGAVTFDKGKCKRRCGILPEYKAQRPPMPEELRSQIETIKAWFRAFGWPILEAEGFEADDLIAGIAGKFKACSVDIVSYDKDLAQLVTPEVNLLQPGKNNSWERIGVEDVREKFQVSPDQIVDYLSLIGDSADNIRGVEGIGPKTAAKLLARFESLTGILEHTGEVGSPKLIAALEESRELLSRNRSLIQLDSCAVPQDLSESSLLRQKPDWPQILALAEKQNFRSLLESLQKRAKSANAPEQLTLF